MDLWIDWKSFFKGIQFMKWPHKHVNYAVDVHFSKRPWFHLWTPVNHEGRGPYITFGFYFIRFVRGY